MKLIVGNSASTGGTIKLNEGTNNGTNFIGLKAPNSVTSTQHLHYLMVMVQQDNF